MELSLSECGPFEEENYLKKGCLAASKFCVFINNILNFNRIFLKVKPLKEASEEANALVA
jgi:predicted transcriptional regulator